MAGYVGIMSEPPPCDLREPYSRRQSRRTRRCRTRSKHWQQKVHASVSRFLHGGLHHLNQFHEHLCSMGVVETQGDSGEKPAKQKNFPENPVRSG